MTWTECTVDCDSVVVYSLGTRVRHKRYPELVGVIESHERHESGAISPLPFFVRWDDWQAASKLIGGVYWCASADTVEPGEARRTMGIKEMLETRPCDVKDGDVFAIKVIAVAGHCNDWAAYKGPTSWPDETVVEVGHKLTRREAGELFYVMSGRRYRE